MQAVFYIKMFDIRVFYCVCFIVFVRRWFVGQLVFNTAPRRRMPCTTRCVTVESGYESLQALRLFCVLIAF
jgi:hypothetical protein